MNLQVNSSTVFRVDGLGQGFFTTTTISNGNLNIANGSLQIATTTRIDVLGQGAFATTTISGNLNIAASGVLQLNSITRIDSIGQGAFATTTIGSVTYASSSITNGSNFTVGNLSYDLTLQGATTTIIATSSNAITFNTGGSERFRVSSSGRIMINTTATSTGLVNIIGSTSATSGIAGIYQESVLNPSVSGNFQFGNRHIVKIEATASSSMIGEFIRMVDNTTLVNTVQAMQIQAWSGTNVQGTNTGIWTAGRTFGLQAFTNGSAGGVSQPAAIYGETTTSTQGQVMRLYSSAIASSSQDFAQFYQEISNFQGNGLKMDFGRAGGTFTGNFLHLVNNQSVKFAVNATGTVMIGTSTPFGTSTMLVVCAATNCTLPTATSTVAVFGSVDGTTTGNSISARGVITGSLADVGEYVPVVGVRGDYEPGDLLSVDVGTSTKFRKSDKPYDQTLSGVVTRASAFVAGGEISDSESAIIMALAGRVPVKVTGENGAIKAGDLITGSSNAGFGMKAKFAGRMVGIALEDFVEETVDATGTIMMFVNPHWAAPLIVEGTSTPDSLQGGDAGAGEVLNSYTFDEKFTVNIGTLRAGKIYVKDLTIGSAEEPAGITFFDRITKEPYCLVIEDGAPKTYAGKCEGNSFEESNLLNGEPAAESESFPPPTPTEPGSSTEPEPEPEPATEPITEPVVTEPQSEPTPETEPAPASVSDSPPLADTETPPPTDTAPPEGDGLL